MPTPSPLPIDEAIPDLLKALAEAGRAVLVAPPGAGKTTRVPLVLLDQPWRGDGRILLIEPRRLAARAAAERMAWMLGERVGETVGLRARLDTRVGPKTRIEVLTEGVFTRMIVDDPSLDGVAAVILDEFHERSLDADLGLALALDCRSGLREDLRLLVMSATLDGARVARLMDNAAVIRSEGRAFPVTARYLGKPADGRIVDAMTAAILRATGEEAGSVLAFLPGQAEIRRTAERLRERIGDPATDIVELYGGLDAREQRRAIEPPEPGRRKIVLATAIAQTSITIDGVRIVVDSGQERLPRYEPDIGVTRLETRRVSRATADQRMGRAGRTEPGVCYRLWDEPETAGLIPFAEPEIRAADLSGLLMDLAAWGVTDPMTLRWLDPPPAGALTSARDELVVIGALDRAGRLTDRGQRMRALPLPPRLAAMVVDSAALGAADMAAEIAALIVERGLGGPSPDLDERLRGFRRDRSPRSESMRRLARGWASSAAKVSTAKVPREEVSTAALVALAWPDRIAKARGTNGQFLLANGRGAMLDAADPLSRADFLVVAEMTGAAAAARIQLATKLEADDLTRVAADRLETREEVTFDRASASLRARRVTAIGAIVLTREPQPPPTDAVAADTLAHGIATLGISRLPWSKAQKQLRDRVGFVAAAEARGGGTSSWPDLSDAGLAATAKQWLAPFIVGLSRLSEITAEHLSQALDTLLPWSLRQRLDAEAPTHFEAPTGNRHAIDYESEGAPILAIRVQELYGLKTHPSLAGGRLPLTLHLLSPAGRPVQITRDLPGFWAGSWRDVKVEMKGRYPRHPWPDDPANAQPTARAKPRGT